MQRHLFAVAASLLLSACVAQPPPGYWDGSTRPYPQAYGSPTYPQGENTPPASQGWDTPVPWGPYASAPRVTVSPQPANDTPQSSPFMPQASPFASQPSQFEPQSSAAAAQSSPFAAQVPPFTPQSSPFAAQSSPDVAPSSEFAPQPASFTSQATSWSPPAGYPSEPEPGGAQATFAEETADYGVPPTNTLHLHDFDAPTPTRIAGAHTITTVELENMLASPRRPALIDVIGGQQTVTLPHAVWLRDAGAGRHLDDDIQAWLDYHLAQLTGDDKSYPVVFFCASRMCWLAYNATLRALDLGYTNLYWYRGGRDAWQAAGLPMVPVPPAVVDN